MQSDGTSGDFVIDFSALSLSSDLRRLIEEEKAEFEAVLGRAVSFRRAGSADEAWIVEVPAAAGVKPQLRWESPSRLVSVAATESELVSTMNALHSLQGRRLRALTVEPVATPAGAAEVLADEVANCYPSFALRSLDWGEICSRHLSAVPDAAEFADFAASWVAELGDAHTAIRTKDSGGFAPPYRGGLERGGVRLSDVPVASAAWEAGVRRGWVVEIEDAERLMRTVGATPQQLAQVRARRALAVHGAHRRFRARDERGEREIEWVEHAEIPTLDNTVSVKGSREDRCVRVRAFNVQLDLHSLFDEVLAGGTPSSRVTIDLRGNTGGSILLATDLRDRFLAKRTLIGYAAFTDGRGGLAPKIARWAEPSERTRWPGRVEILIDAMTYSASEDFILGLQGLEHVCVKGSVSGGGSGRPRRVPLLPGIDLTISTAITYDRRGLPVEYRGIHPDEVE